MAPPTAESGRRENPRACITWNDYFMTIALVAAQRSKDPCTKVGACIVNKNNVVTGIGYNAMPKGNDELFPWGKRSADELQNRHTYVCHAELNAILNKNAADLKDCKIYVTLFPCNECAKLIIQSGIKEVVYFSDKRAKKPYTIAAKEMFDAAGVEYRKFIPDNPKTITIDLVDQTTDDEQSMEPPWNDYFMTIALVAAQRSKDPSTQVGACIINKNNVVTGIGYNAMAKGKDELFPWGKGSTDELENKYMYVCHAVLNAILNTNAADVEGCTIYVTLFPCNECAKIIIQSGIKEIVYFSNKYKDLPSTKAAKKMFDAVGVKYRKFTPHNSTPIEINLVN